MIYAIIKVINGHYFVHSEGITTLESAKTQFHSLCATLWNAPDVQQAMVKIVDEQLNCVDGYMDLIIHETEEEE